MATINLGRIGFVNKGDYNALTAYKVNDIVKYTSGTYACKLAHTGQVPTETTYWQEWVDDNAVHKTGDETVAGTKTFSSPIKLANSGFTATLQSGTLSGDVVHTLPKVSDTLAGISNIVGLKNYITNGNFDVWQYGTSQTASGYGSDDRWININFGSTKTHSQVACTDTERALFNASNFSRTVVSSVVGASNQAGKRQSIEDVAKLAGKTVTISFLARADSNKKLGYRMFQSFGTGGSPSAENSFTNGVLDITSTWQKKTITVNIPSIVGKTLGTDGVHTSSTGIKFIFDAGTVVASLECPLMIQQSGTFDIAQVQLEEGSVATPFEQRPYGLELSLCKRYARDIGNNQLYGQIGNGFAYSSTGALIEVDVEGMRTTPVISNTLTANQFELESSGRHTLSAISINAFATANTNKISLNCTTTGLTAGWAVGLRNNNNSTNKIILSSEL